MRNAPEPPPAPPRDPAETPPDRRVRMLHFRTGTKRGGDAAENALTACRRWLPHERTTVDRNGVTCRTCLRSFRFWTAG